MRRLFGADSLRSDKSVLTRHGAALRHHSQLLPKTRRNSTTPLSWVVADFQVDDAFGPEPTDLWRAVLRRQGGHVAWMANYPDEIALN